MEQVKTINIKRNIFESNQNDIKSIREKMAKEHIFFLNLLSAPGEGKTAILKATIRALKDTMKIGVLSADSSSDVNARAIIDAGADAIQLNTRDIDYLDANMIKQALDNFEYYKYDLVILDNIGNLITPPLYDVGANEDVLIISVPGGDDKALKYPAAFKKASRLLIAKMDVAPYFDFSLEKCSKYARKFNKDIKIYTLSAKTGQGMKPWFDYLEKEISKVKTI